MTIEELYDTYPDLGAITRWRSPNGFTYTVEDVDGHILVGGRQEVKDLKTALQLYKQSVENN